MIRRLLLPDMMIWHCAQFQMRASVPFSLHQNIHRAPHAESVDTSCPPEEMDIVASHI
jgi:hypothetical protein